MKIYYPDQVVKLTDNEGIVSLDLVMEWKYN